MFGIGTQELLIILVIALVLFGSKKLPEIGSGLGRAIRNFKRAVSENDQIDITPTGADKAKQPETSPGSSDKAGQS
jgi:sec-independent protein translocase protein TatA